MKTILTFEVDDAEGLGDVTRLHRILKTDQLFRSVWDFDQWLRNKLKYDTNLSRTSRKALQESWDALRSILEEHGLNLDSETL